MRIGVAAIVLAVCAGLSAQHLRHFRSDLDLWRHAAAVSPRLARPATNVGTAYRKAGEDRLAVLWLVRGAELSGRDLQGADIRATVQAQLRWMSAFGADVCGRPFVAPHC